MSTSDEKNKRKQLPKTVTLSPGFKKEMVNWITGYGAITEEEKEQITFITDESTE